MAAARRHEEIFKREGGSSPLWGRRQSRGEGCKPAVARGRQAASGEGTPPSPMKTRPATRPPTGSRAAAGLHSTPSAPSLVIFIRVQTAPRSRHWRAVDLKRPRSPGETAGGWAGGLKPRKAGRRRNRAGAVIRRAARSPPSLRRSRAAATRRCPRSRGPGGAAVGRGGRPEEQEGHPPPPAAQAAAGLSTSAVHV